MAEEMAGRTPKALTWPRDSLLPAPSKGAGGLPFGLLLHAHSATWLMLTTSRWRVWIRLRFVVDVTGPEGDELRAEFGSSVAWSWQKWHERQVRRQWGMTGVWTTIHLAATAVPKK